MTQPEKGGRIFPVDVLRGVAICLVVARHMPVTRLSGSGMAEHVVRGIQRVGWCGVDLFFVLSGFLVSGLLLEELDRSGRLDVRRFWVRRALRICPSYYVVFGAAVALWCARALWTGATDVLPAILTDAVFNGLFVQNYVSCTAWPHSWALAVMVHWYLLPPLVLASLVRIARLRGRGASAVPRWLVGLCAAGCVGVLAARVAMADRGWHALYYKSHFRADTFCFGVIIACLCRYRREWARRVGRYWCLLLLGVLAAGAVPAWFSLEQGGITPTIGFTALYLAFGGAVLLARVHVDFGKSGPRLFVWPMAGLAFIGSYSYTIYLAHSIIPGADFARRSVLGRMGAICPKWTTGGRI